MDMENDSQNSSYVTKWCYEHGLPHPPPLPPEDEKVIPGRIRLNDGRQLAYIEKGVSKYKSKFKLIVIHGFGSSKEMNFILPPEVMDELGIYMVQYDRAGYGESDPNLHRSVKSEALDIEQLADQLQLGTKFYVIGVSLGSYPTWGCLRHIPDRLAGVAFVVPVINYHWRFLPKSLTRKDYRSTLVHISLWFAKHAPQLLQWLVTRKWQLQQRNNRFFNRNDIDMLKQSPGFPMLTQEKLRERVVFDTLRHDIIAGFDDWDFDPMDVVPGKGVSVHMWQGYQDKVVPFKLQRFVARKLPWIRYHEVAQGGHLIVRYDGICEAIVRALLLQQQSSFYKPNCTTLFKTMT